MEVIPERYILKIYADPNRESFDGEAEIVAHIKGSADKIVLNAKELEIKKAYAFARSGGGAENIENVEFKLDKKKEELSLLFGRKLSGEVHIKIEYKGRHGDEMCGFYRSRYAAGGKEEYMLTTQLESSDARAVLPCFDKPSMKAVFEVTLVIDKELDAISNMPIKEIKSAGEKKEVIFYPTPKMSTYLLYLGVGRFEYLNGRLGKTKIRVVTTPGKLKYAKLPLLFTKQFVSFYEKYFKIKYPLPKLDIIAVPDFAAGAMENWGAITFREVDLLVDEEKTSTLGRRRVAEVVAHELAHQWFGDLVTMKWWDDLWLNESFATYMSYKAMGNVYPEWRVDLEYLYEVVATAMGSDQLESTHPINVKVNSPAEIESIFDNISYEKGGSVLRMLEDYVGEDTFREGLHNYLKRHAYSNATKFDLWNAIQEEAKKRGKALKVNKVAKAWIDKPGYPIIKESRAKGYIKLEQERFTLLGNKKKELWPIPITYLAYSKDRKGIKKLLLEAKAKSIEESCDFIKLNYGQKGFYRVKYEHDNLILLGSAYKSRLIDDVEGFGIESDLYNMLRARYIGLDEYLDFISNYMLDAGYPLNMQISSHLMGLNMLTYNLEVNKKVKDVALAYFRNAVKRIGYYPKKGEDELVKLFRPRAIAGLGLLGDEEAERFADENFKKALSGSFDPDLSPAVLSISAWNGGGEVFESIREAYLKEEFPEKKVRLLSSLGSFKNKELCSRALDYSLSKEVRLQDSFYIPAAVSSNPEGRELLLPWVEKNWHIMKMKFREGTHMLPRFVEMLGSYYGEEKLKEVEGFFTDKRNYTPAIKKALKETLEEIRINTLFIEHIKR